MIILNIVTDNSTIKLFKKYQPVTFNESTLVITLNSVNIKHSVSNTVRSTTEKPPLIKRKLKGSQVAQTYWRGFFSSRCMMVLTSTLIPACKSRILLASVSVASLQDTKNYSYFPFLFNGLMKCVLQQGFKISACSVFVIIYCTFASF